MQTIDTWGLCHQPTHCLCRASLFADLKEMSHKVLITGISGYIGGTVLRTILDSPSAGDYKISAIVRKEEHAAKLRENHIQAIMFEGLHDVEALKKAASENDVVIHTASASDEGAAKALMQGLGDRRKKLGQDVHFIHTSGTSILSDHSAGEYEEPRVYSDMEDMYLWEKSQPEPYILRTVDVAVFEMGINQDIKTYIICPPTIYGIGTGWFNKLTIQVPKYTKLAIQEGKTMIIGQGKSRWSHIGVLDLAELYETMLRKIVQGENVPSNKQGFYFSQSGEHSWAEVGDGIAKALKKQGIISSDSVTSISAEETAPKIGFPLARAKITLASNSRSKDDRARSLGWKPKHTNENFYTHFDEEVRAVVAAEGK